METNTVTIALDHYNELRDFKLMSRDGGKIVSISLVNMSTLSTRDYRETYGTRIMFITHQEAEKLLSDKVTELEEQLSKSEHELCVMRELIETLKRISVRQYKEWINGKLEINGNCSHASRRR